MSLLIIQTKNSHFVSKIAVFGAANRTRTGTKVTFQWILSPRCLPIPP